jgi:hypothetical protein
MCPTPLGRTQTRTAILVGPALLGLVLSLATDNEAWIVLIGIYLLMGVALDLAFYPLFIKWQPPWLTFVLGIGEFVILYVLAHVMKVGLTNWQAVWFYWVSWLIAVTTRIVVLPIVSLSWIENGGEFRRTGWSVPPEQEPMPILAEAPADPRAVALASEFSAVGDVPEELRNLPSPTVVGAVQRPSEG